MDIFLIFRKIRIFYKHISTGDIVEYFIFYQLFTKCQDFLKYFILCYNVSMFYDF